MTIILSILLTLSIVAFGLAYYLRNSEVISGKWYSLILSFGAAIIISIVILDFLPHQYETFSQIGVEQEVQQCSHEDHSHHNHDHHSHAHSEIELNWVTIAQFSLLVLVGFFAQIGLEKFVQSKINARFNSFTLAFGLFLHSFSETAVLFEHNNVLNETLFMGILFHKLPVSFVLAYTLLNQTSLKMSLMWYGMFLLSIPLGLVCNYYMTDYALILNIVSVFVAGMMMHVIWHIIHDVKEKNKLFYLVLIIGGLVGYGITLFHQH